MGRATGTVGVSIITCTNRPQFFDNILKNYRRQQYRNKELIIILNNDSMNLKQYRRKTRTYDNVTVYKIPEKISLGQCLNSGISRTRLPIIAKFDDDDYYSPFYLMEQVKALIRTKSDIVGKHACLVYLEATKKLVVRSPKEKNKYLEFVQGGTILFRRRVLKKVHFADRSVGEDVTFLKECMHKGFVTYATSPLNYVYMRRKNKKSHTWRVGDEHYLNGSKAIAVTENYRVIADREK
ncbi:glycosyltransferase [Paenibacillus crassostreae]|uniref:Glycosyl transferase family 2 n=1 Tax=Paenibacillus crassostreae TaxID=1763538 RepID=A0A167DW80_9BACL|nr:glycosyltransferase family A protein [Paenibacillus crassostreae]AOZ90986.1 glycosyl transferase family 2 [Paenibacillus crassostreae]OAB74851.1 glycosyl transferase family 2 [Paenibacillus crassostreae]